MTCALCDAPAAGSGLAFVDVDAGVQLDVGLCPPHASRIYKHLKRQVPKAHFTLSPKT